MLAEGYKEKTHLTKNKQWYSAKHNISISQALLPPKKERQGKIRVGFSCAGV